MPVLMRAPTTSVAPAPDPTRADARREGRALLRPPDAARFLSMSRSTFNRLRARGMLPEPVRVETDFRGKPRMTFFARRDLERWVDWGMPDAVSFAARARAERLGRDVVDGR